MSVSLTQLDQLFKDSRFKKCKTIITSIFPIIYTFSLTAIIFCFINQFSVKNFDNFKLDFTHILNLTVATFFTILVLFLYKIQPWPTIAVCSLFYSYVIVHNTELISYLNLQTIFGNNFDSNMLKWITSGIFAVIICALQVLIVYLTKLFEKKVFHVFETNKEQTEVDLQKKKFSFIFIQKMIKFTTSNLLFTFLSFIDVTFFFYCSKMMVFGPFLYFVIFTFTILNSVIYKYALIYLNYKIFDDSYQKTIQTEIRPYQTPPVQDLAQIIVSNAETDLVIPFSTPVFAQNQDTNTNNMVSQLPPIYQSQTPELVPKTKPRGFFGGLYASLPFFILFPYSLLAGVPLQKNLKCVFRNGLNSAIIRIILNDPYAILQKGSLNLSDYTILLIFINFIAYTLFKDITPVLLMLFFCKRTTFFLLDAFDVSTICGLINQ
ncbi:hypothetical protein M153_7030004539 [Pseudoloma neurophilia]|uniref:Uncharacterized protein n=1 Tax=Pseudoloma neurophilia TaxID=146866 RepID=A0A0R0M0G0_9MICR|nr:hypothetical protein M153_7030004539 [Pseudoloma neurophilia]